MPRGTTATLLLGLALATSACRSPIQLQGLTPFDGPDPGTTPDYYYLPWAPQPSKQVNCIEHPITHEPAQDVIATARNEAEEPWNPPASPYNMKVHRFGWYPEGAPEIGETIYDEAVDGPFPFLFEPGDAIISDVILSADWDESFPRVVFWIDAGYIHSSGGSESHRSTQEIAFTLEGCD